MENNLVKRLVQIGIRTLNDHQIDQVNRFGVEDSRIAVVPHGNYDLYSRWIKADIYEEKGTILFFGRLYKYKGLEYLIKAEPIISKEISSDIIYEDGKYLAFSDINPQAPIHILIIPKKTLAPIAMVHIYIKYCNLFILIFIY